MQKFDCDDCSPVINQIYNSTPRIGTLTIDLPLTEPQ